MADAVEQRVVGVDVGGAAEGTPIWLVIEAEGGSCAIAAGEVRPGGVGVGPLGAARAEWLGARVTATTTQTSACLGLPTLEPLVVPPFGAAVGVVGAVRDADVEGAFSVRPIGDQWWEVRPLGVGPGVVVFRREDAPPVGFTVAGDPEASAPPGASVQVASGGVAVLPVAPSFLDLGPNPVVEVVPVGEGAVVLGRRGGAVDGLWRLGQAAPEPVRVVVGPPLRARDDEVRVPAGGRRIRRPDEPVLAAFVGDPAVVEVVPDGARLRFVGVEPGRTEVALQTAHGVSIVTVAVGR